MKRRISPSVRCITRPTFSNRFISRHQTLLAALLVLGVMMGALAVGQPLRVSYAKRGAERGGGRESLLAAAPLKASLMVPVGPTLGNYPGSTAALSGDVTVTPDAAPVGATGINVKTSTNFKGTFAADLTTGVVRVTDAHPAGTYTVTVRAFDSGGASDTRTFTLTVQAGTACAGTVAFTNAADASVGSAPFSVAIGDFNNDGKQDIAAANFNSATVSIRLGDGLGGFSGTTDVSVGTGPVSVAIGDFNNDGKQDIAAANQWSDTVSIRLGDGAGGFSGTTDVSVDRFPTSVAIGDFNNDGKQDIAVAAYVLFFVSIRLGDGAGGFSGTTEVRVGPQPASVAIGDFNNDGKQDIATADDGGNTVSLRFGDGAGGFTGDGLAGIGARYVSVGSHPISVAVGDFNNDGTQDIAAANYASDTVSIRLGDGAGYFTSPATPDVTVGSHPHSVAVGDFNNDGKQDIATANVNSDTVSILIGDGAGGFSGTTDVRVGSHPYSVAVGDFNNDGKQDIAAASSGSNTVSIRLAADCILPPVLGNYPNTTVSLGSETTITPSAVPANTAGINVSTSTDFKGTFAVDPATGVVRVTNAHPAGTYTVTVRAFNSSGISTSQTFTLTVQAGTACAGTVAFTNAADASVGSFPASVAVGDFNNDGKQDIAAANLFSNTVSIRLGNGLGGFSGTTNVSVGSAPVSVAVGDFNNDGKQDIATANLFSNTVSIRLGDGLGNFSGTTNVSVGTNPQSVAVGDFNNDGKQDIAAANSVSNTVSIRLGDGLGGFSGTTNVSVGSGPVSVAVGDFNNDGKQDIAAANYISNTVSILIGDGAGNFSGTTDVSVGVNPYSVAVGDFNNDGNQDIAVANLNSNTVSIRLGDGAGGFSGTTDVSVGTQPSSVAVGDFNNDGKQDFAAANDGSNTVSIRIGDGLGGFTGTTNVAVGTQPRSVAVGDFNGDGKQDIAAANYSSNTVSIRLGRCNSAPTITAATGLSRQQGSPASNSQIATVTDDGGNGNVAVIITSANPSNGVTISNISNTGGNITANISAGCTASDASFTLQASDGTATATATLNITVTANTAPTLTYASPQAVAFNGSLTVTPTTATDNGSITSYSVQSVTPALTTAPTVDSSGVVSITNAQPIGAHTITIRATDDCGLTTDASFTLNVSKADQTITFGTLADKTFGDPDFTVSATASSGLSVSFTTSGQCTVTGSTVHLTSPGSCTITASQAGDSNYNAATHVDQAFTINKANQTIIFNGLPDKTYGDAPFTVSATGGASGNAVTFSSTTPAVCTVSGDTVTIVSAGTCTIRASQAGDGNYNAASDVDQSFTVAKAASTTTVTVSNATYDGQPHGGTATVTGAGGLNQSVTITYTGRNGTVYSSATAPTNVGDYTASATFAGDANHDGSSDSKDFTISKATPTITWSNPADITYGTALSGTQLNATASVAGSFIYTPAAGTVLHAGANQTLHVAFTPTDTVNYNAASKDVTINVAKAALTVKADDKSRAYGAANPALTYNITGFVGSDTQASATTGAPALSTTATPASSVGGYPITVTVGTLSSADYSFTFSNGTLSVTKADQTITFGALSNKTYGDAPFNLSATSTSGLPVAFSIVSGPATVSGNTLTITGVGHVIVRASQTGDTNYNAAPAVDRAFDVTTASATISLSNLSQGYDGTAKAPTVTTTPAGLSYTLTYTQNGSPVPSPTNAGSYNVTATITDTNYQGTTSGTLVINKVVPIITWNNPANITSGTPLSSTQLNATANVAGTFTYNPPSGTVLGVGTHQLSVTFTPADTVNYTTAQASVSITVDPVPNATLAFDSATYSVNEGGGHATITINRTGITGVAVSVDYQTSDAAGLNNCDVVTGNASQRCDYTGVRGTLSFIAGQTTATFEVPIINDVYVEGPETLTLTLSNPVGGTLGSQAVSTLSITDNDLAPGAPNPIDNASFFIREQYLDFLNREPEASGLQAWLNILNNCPAGDKSCDRIAVSSGFFRSREFFDRAYYVFRFYETALDRKPTYAEYQEDIKRLTGFLTDAELEQRKAQFAEEFVQRPEFKARYDAFVGGNDYVNAIVATAGVTPSNRTNVADRLQQQLITRGQALRELLESPEISQAFYNEAFVVVAYFAYLRREPDALYLDWIQKLNNPPAGQTYEDTYREMIGGFINSLEYRARFGQ